MLGTVSLPVIGPDASPCVACAADCCRGFEVVVQSFDVYRLARDLQRAPEDFVELQWADRPDEDHQIILDAEAAPRRYGRLSLRRVDDPPHALPQRCVFLLAAGERGRCGAYASRPTVCRAYPTFLDGGLLALTHARYCPPGGWELARMDAPRFYSHQLFWRRQRALHDLLTDGWNERVLVYRERHAERDFFAYLLTAYGELERRAPRWLVEPGPGMADTVTDEEMRAAVVTLLTERQWLPEGA